ncbi:MAG: outer membrane beta-barrel protein [Gemmatimonadota bacterium]|nr:outer membrane beta-barrel protein [Gemmatimonadota bacterium]
MRRFTRSALVVLLAMAGDASSAMAQDTPLFSLGGGLATPSGVTGNAHTLGFQAGATGVFPITGRLGIATSASYIRLGADQNAVLAETDIDPESFELGGGFIDGGYRWIGGVTVGLRLLLRPRDRQIVPNLAAGVGWAFTGVADRRIWYLGEIEPIEGFNENAPLMRLGGGVEAHVRDGVGLFGAVRYVVAFTNPDRTTALPFTFGVSLRLEER